MLVITRKLEEGIIIDGDIEVVVLGIEEGKVKLGINAPRDKKIYRREIFEAIKRENQDAITSNRNMLQYLPKKK